MHPARPCPSKVLFLLTLSLVGALLAGVPAVAQQAVSDPTTEAVRKALYRFFELAEVRDWDGVGELFADDFQLYTDGAVSFDRAGYVEVLKADDLEVDSWELRDLEIRVAGDGSLAWCRYRGSFRTRSHGEASAVETVETLVFTRVGEQWKISQSHASIKTAAQ